MVDSLKVPETFACGGLESEEGVGVEIIAKTGGSVEIGYGRAGGNVDDAALEVDCHASPVVGGTGGLPGVRGPGLVTGLAGMRDGVEGPAKSAGADVEGADVTGRRRQ